MTSINASGAGNTTDLDMTAGSAAANAQAMALAAAATKADGTALGGNVQVGLVVKIKAAANHTFTDTGYQFKEITTTSATLKKGRTYVMTLNASEQIH